jgi:transketolase
MATGSEVSLVMTAGERLQAENISVRLVSMPSWELFDEQPRDYRDAVLPPSVPARLAVEAGATQGWHKYVGDRGAVLGIDRFGASAPGATVMREMGFSAESVFGRAFELIAGNRKG